MGGWQFWVDRGGTFTDLVARRPDGTVVSHKILSHDPERYDDATVAGIRRLLGVEDDQPIDTSVIDVVKMGTTVATNALLEGNGEPTVLVTTRGFADALAIADQARPRLFDLNIQRAKPVYERVIEVSERVDASGKVVVPLDIDAARADLREVFEQGCRAVAIVLMHGYRHTEHEEALIDIARDIGFPQISASCRVSPLLKMVSRGDTAVVDAHLSPVLRRYVDSLTKELPGVRLMFMQSNGGLAEAHHFHGKDSILSGPAGGIVGMAGTSAMAGFHKVIGFDMGGTSTDVSHYAGEFERVTQSDIAGLRIRAPMLDIHTVAAGGGSILHFDGARLRVGPDSAGADPGPACYRRGGPLTVTDANLLLGRIQADHFPRIFGPDGDQPLDSALVAQRFDALATDVEASTGTASSPESIALGFLEIAVANMANAIKRISVQRGRDVTEYALTTFGGAGGQHACAVADALGITDVLLPPLAGVLSAYGLGLADTTEMRERSVDVTLDETAMPVVEEVGEQLAAEAREALRHQGVDADRIEVTHRVHLHYAGTDTHLIIRAGTVEEMRAEFDAAYRRQFSFLQPSRRVIIAAVSVEALARAEPAALALAPAAGRGWPSRGTVRMHTGGEWTTVPLYHRSDGNVGDRIDGPAMIIEDNSTTVVDTGWAVRVTELGHLHMQRVAARRSRRELGTAVDPIMLEVFNNLFMATAEQMGERLRATAHSVNIKERLDYSCAVFDDEGNLIANAPHMPVHLGSMGESIKQVIRRRGADIRQGDVYALNDPYRGGTHLPDITVVTPVFDSGGGSVLYYVASRGHHAEVGGLTPGSMPPHSHTIEEEGVVFDNWLLVRDGQLREDETRELLTSARYPSRDPDTNLADLRAQVAANEKGVQELHAMIEHFGLDVVHAYMGHVRDNAREAVRKVIDALSDGQYTYQHDTGFTIEVAITVDRAARSARIDFTGTSPQLAGNFNAPSAVARAAALYVFRTLVADEIPLNDGCLDPLELVIPEGCMLAPRYPAATVAGNVETSQAVTSALYGALGVLAEGAGTMNNLIFGNDSVQYYETISSGSGAGNGFGGADVVQTHMTNSALTDPEVLETRYPVLLDSYEINRGSGGHGRWHGGGGGIRRIRFLAPMTVSILSGNRSFAPYGMAGGSTGALGRNRVERADGSVAELGGVDRVDVGVGDVIEIRTPGGGGYGEFGQD